MVNEENSRLIHFAKRLQSCTAAAFTHSPLLACFHIYMALLYFPLSNVCNAVCSCCNWVILQHITFLIVYHGLCLPVNTAASWLIALFVASLCFIKVMN